MSSNEWYTPSRYVEAARLVMGGIELDPASCELANQVVKAERFFSKQENGLVQEWRARSLWLNPPYGHTRGRGGTSSYQKLFAEKLLLDYQQGAIEQAILLSLGNPSSIWFHAFFDFPQCVHRGHLHFYGPNGERANFGFPLAFVYLGPNVVRFTEIFSRFGRIIQAIDRPSSHPIARPLWTIREVGA